MENDEQQFKIKQIKKEILSLRKINKNVKQNIKRKHKLIENLKEEINNFETELNHPRYEILRSCFSETQINVLKGTDEKIYWTDDDLAQAFTIRHMGGKNVYLYLKNSLNYPLPSLRCVQAWAANN